MDSSLPERIFAAIVDSSEDVIIVLDARRAIRFVNAAAVEFGKRCGVEAMLGISFDDFLKRSLILDSDGNEATLEEFPNMAVAREGKHARGQVLRQVINTTYTWMKASSIPIANAEGKIEYIIVRLTDITKRKSTEDKLDFLLQTSKVLAITADTEERLAQKAQLTVPQLADWCTVSVVYEGGLLSQSTVVHRDPEKEGIVRDFAERTARGGPTMNIVRRVIETGTAAFYPTVTGSPPKETADVPEWLALARALGVTSIMVLPISSRGIVRGVLSLAYSDSKRRYTDEDFEFMQEYCNHISLLLETAHLYEEIKKRDASKDSFLAKLSHELRNPLAPIKSMLELMKLQPHAAEFRHNISVIEHQFDHLTRILTDLLEVNRYAQGKVHIELRRVNLLTVVKNSVESAEPFFKKKDIVLEVALPSQTVVIRADQTRLEQALMNILHNAEKFTPEGGRIWIHVATDDRTATITIGDTGKGIAPEMLGHIFDPSWARDEKVPHTTEGLGLGLMLVKEIVQLHGGTVSVKSEGEGKGSEFTITLPIPQKRLF